MLFRTRRNVNKSHGHRAWLSLHGASERGVYTKLVAFFSDQAKRIVDATENFQGLSPDSVGLIFQGDAEHELLLPIVRRNLGNLMVIGAQVEATALGSLRSEAKAADPLDTSFGDFLPYGVRQRIRTALDDVARQPYWRRIQDETEADLAEIIKESLDAGLSPHAMSVRIRDQLGGFQARKRAMLIARTETTGALNAGHEAERADLMAAGIVLGREWSAVLDDDTRSSHVDVNGTIVGPNQMFVVGGHECPFPGYWGLPGEQRCNCRCTTLSTFDPSLLV